MYPVKSASNVFQLFPRRKHTNRVHSLIILVAGPTERTLCFKVLTEVVLLLKHSLPELQHFLMIFLGSTATLVYIPAHAAVKPQNGSHHRSSRRRHVHCALVLSSTMKPKFFRVLPRIICNVAKFVGANISGDMTSACRTILPQKQTL